VSLASWRRRLKATIARRLPPFVMPEARTEVLRRLGVVIGEGSIIYGELHVVPQGALSLLRFGRDCSVTGPLYVQVGDEENGSEVSIGNGVCMGHFISIYTHSHAVGPAEKRCAAELTCDPVTIGDGTWIASHVVILPGTRIGKGCIVGAGSVVNRSMPCKDDVFISGNPARVVGPVRALAAVG
jgi:maltose O-acetyltransferase